MATKTPRDSNPRRDDGAGKSRRDDGAGRSRRDDNTRSRRQPSGVDETVAQLAGPLSRVLKRLPATQRQVLELRMGLSDGHPHDLADTADALGLSMSEAREIEARAFAYIREAIPPKQLKQLHRFLS